MPTPASSCTPAVSNGARADLPITQGSLLDFPRDPIACMRSLYERHGHLAALEENGARIVFAFGPEYNQRILSDTKTFHSQFFAIRGPKNSSQRRLTSGLLSMNGEDHKRNRRIVMGPFQKRSIETYRDSLVGLVEDMLADWRPGQVRNIFADMTQFMLRVTSSMLFGFDRTDLAYSIGQKTERWVQLNHEMGIGSLRARRPRSGGLRRSCCSRPRELEARHRADDRVPPSSSEQGNDVLSLLIRAHDDEGVGLTDEELIGQAAVLFAAAHLTTANTLTWTLFLLAQHPQVAQALYDELTGALGGNPPTLEQLERLPMLDRVVKESMRSAARIELLAADQRRAGRAGTACAFAGHARGLQPVHHASSARDVCRALSLPSRAMGLDRSIAVRVSALRRRAEDVHRRVAGDDDDSADDLARFGSACGWRSMPGANINGKVTSTMLGPTTGMPMLVLSQQVALREPLGSRQHPRAGRARLAGDAATGQAAARGVSRPHLPFAV